MKKVFLSLVTLTLVLSSSFVQTGGPFPEITAESLNGKTVTVPKETEGKSSIIGVAFSEKSREELKTWFEPMYNVFINKGEPDPELSDPYNSHVYFISLFSKDSEYEEAKKQWQTELNEKMQSYVLISKENHSAFKRNLSVGNEDEAVIYILDPQGRIILTVTGEYSDEKKKKIVRLVVEG